MSGQYLCEANLTTVFDHSFCSKHSEQCLKQNISIDCNLLCLIVIVISFEACILAKEMTVHLSDFQCNALSPNAFPMSTYMSGK